MNDYTTRTAGCVTRMQEDLGWDTLQNRRRDSRLSMLYKIDQHLVDVKEETYLQSGDSRTRGGHKFYQERTTSEQVRYTGTPFSPDCHRMEQAPTKSQCSRIPGRILQEPACQTHHHLDSSYTYVQSFSHFIVNSHLEGCCVSYHVAVSQSLKCSNRIPPLVTEEEEEQVTSNH